MQQPSNYYFQTTVTRVNLASVMQALRASDAPADEISANIKSLTQCSIAQGKARAVDLLLQYNLAYISHSKNKVLSHDDSICFADIRWALQTVGKPKAACVI